MNNYDSRPREVRAGVLRQSVYDLLDAQREVMNDFGGSASGLERWKITASGDGGWSAELQRNRGNNPGYAGSFQPGKRGPSMPFEWKISGYSPEGQPTTVEGGLEGLGKIEIQCKTKEDQQTDYLMWLQRSLGEKAGADFFGTLVNIWPKENRFFVAIRPRIIERDSLTQDDEDWQEYEAERYVVRDLARACEILGFIQSQFFPVLRSDSITITPDFFKLSQLISDL